MFMLSKFYLITVFAPLFERTVYERTVSAFPKAQWWQGGAFLILEMVPRAGSLDTLSEWIVKTELMEDVFPGCRFYTGKENNKECV